MQQLYLEFWFLDSTYTLIRAIERELSTELNCRLVIPNWRLMELSGNFGGAVHGIHPLFLRYRRKTAMAMCPNSRYLWKSPSIRYPLASFLECKSIWSHEEKTSELPIMLTLKAKVQDSIMKCTWSKIHGKWFLGFGQCFPIHVIDEYGWGKRRPMPIRRVLYQESGGDTLEVNRLATGNILDLLLKMTKLLIVWLIR